jgi:hypothetical protein
MGADQKKQEQSEEKEKPAFPIGFHMFASCPDKIKDAIPDILRSIPLIHPIDPQPDRMSVVPTHPKVPLPVFIASTVRRAHEGI